jgi:hypothetical protein
MHKSNSHMTVSLFLLVAFIVSFGACLAVEDDCCQSHDTACSEICHCACAFASISPVISIDFLPLSECGTVGLSLAYPEPSDLGFDLDRPPRVALS